MRLKNYENTDELEQAKDDGYIETRYQGKTPTLLHGKRGKKGHAYYNVHDDIWYFRPLGDENWYRVRATSLDCL